MRPKSIFSRNPLLSRLSAVLRAFGRANQGNVALVMGLTLVPAVGMTGAAIDYSRANSVKAGMQTALDATALMLAKEAAVIGQAQVNVNAQKYFKSMFSRRKCRPHS